MFAESREVNFHGQATLTEALRKDQKKIEDLDLNLKNKDSWVKDTTARFTIRTTPKRLGTQKTKTWMPEPNQLVILWYFYRLIRDYKKLQKWSMNPKPKYLHSLPIG